MLAPSIVSAGFSHSAVINTKGNLYVWGDNKNQQLTTTFKDQPQVDRPSQIRLKYKTQEYKAKSVVCGPNFTFVLASNKQKQQINLDEDEQEILNPLKEILKRKGTLAGFFGLIGKKRSKYSSKQQDIDPHGKGQMHSFLNQESESEQEQDEDEVLKTEEAEVLHVSRNQFIDSIERAQFTQKKNRIHFLADRLIEERKDIGENILLGDIEDYALGFRQGATKVFAFGQGHKRIFAFQKKLDDMQSEDGHSDVDQDDDNYRQKHLQKQYLNEVIIIARPTAIKFPKHSRPIVQIACGSAHILAITENLELYSWGFGQYGALGFGTRDDVIEPRLLVIEKNDQIYSIVGVACGKYHSLCVTDKKKVLSWGMGQGGRLGQGDEEDILIPKDIHELSKKKIIYVSAGESHSAAITEKLQLYTWGNGTYGRLGHGLDINEKKPKLVEDLDQSEVIHVSCGAFHTLVVTGQGFVYAFGQNKYGKLGINRKQREGIFARPDRISFYKFSTEQQDMLVQDKNEALLISAGYNHSICLSRSGKIYSWGYNGKGILGRQKGFEEHIPLEIGQIPGEILAKLPNVDEIIQRGDQKQEELFSYEIIQVACGSLNTVSLTNGGEVYVFGSNAYGQLGKDKEHGQNKKQRRQDQDQNDMQNMNEISEHMALIRFPGESTVRINYIACGGEHIFAISRMNELFGWGKNDEGQLGLGFVSDLLSEPALIKDIAHKNIQMIGCGDNYSAAVSAFGEVFVTGNLEGGKLGLGQAMKKGFILNFTLIQGLAPIKFIACGPNHMLAISEYNPDENEIKDGMCYAWGKNYKGQLGIGSKEDSNVPRKITNAKERFKKVACGYDFSIGLSINNQIYMWGNSKYYCDSKVVKDIEIPQLLQSMDTAQIKDITCSYKYCTALNDKGEIMIWGQFLIDKMKQKAKKGKGQTVSNYTVQKFPMRKFDFLMESLSTGPNHSAAVSVKKSLYSWGHPEGGRLGLSEKEFKNAKLEPILVQNIHDLMQKNRQNLKEGRGGADEDIKTIQFDQNNEMIQEEQKHNMNNMEEKKQQEKYVLKDDYDQRIDSQQNEENKHGEFGQNAEEEEDAIGDIDDIENQIIQEQEVPLEKLNLVSLSRQQSLVESHILLQKILKKERADQLDENYILKYDDELMKEIDMLLTQFKQYKSLEKERQNILTQIESAFLTRINETPFLIQPRQIQDAVEQKIQSFKKQIKQFLTILHIHPCYLIKLYSSQLIQQKEYQRFFKEIYSYQNERVNYLQMAACQGIIEYEIKGCKSLEEVNFLSKDSVVGKIVKLIFKSQETNIDTVCSLACHVINKLLNKFSSSSTNSQDNSFDVTERLNKNSKQFEVDKVGKINILPKRAKDLFSFIEEVIKDLMENEVLYPQSSYFIPKKQHVDDINYKKSLAIQGQEQLQKLESLRFSPEISYLAELISKKLREIPSKGAVDDQINSKILSLIFGMIDKVWKNYEIYLFPYIKTVKGLSIIEDVINKTHFNNLENIFSVFNCFFRNESAFPEFIQSDQWCKDFNLKLIHLQQSTKGIILTRIIDKNPMKQISFKNFENLILHSLESEGHTITIRNKSLGKMINLFKENSNKLSQVQPVTNDPLYQVLDKISDDYKTLIKCKKYEKTNFKLKTRLLIEDDNMIASRCNRCNVILIQKYAPPESVSILEKYNPEDSQSLVVQYCNILKQIQDINKTESITEYIEKIYNHAKRNAAFDLANRMLKFLNQVEQEVQNVLTKNSTNQQIGAQEHSETKIKEQIYLEIQKLAEIKINERRTRKYDLTLIQRRIQNVLKKKIQVKVKQISEKEIMLYKVTLYNIQYGLANHELKHLADAYTLKNMRRTIDFTTSSKMSKNLFKNLRNEQKFGLRAIVKKSAKSLLQNQTIVGLKLASLKPLINNCEFFFIEAEDLSITVKIVYREQKWSMCGPPKILSEAVLLTFSITQKQLLELRKNIKSPENKRLTLANSFEFDSIKLLRIFNEMDRSKSAYLLNSGATPLILQKQIGQQQEDDARV